MKLKVKVFLALLLVGTGAGAQEAPPGQWVLRQAGVETVFRFDRQADGEVRGTVVRRTGTAAGAPYGCLNAQFSGRPLVGGVWIWGLQPREPGRWAGGMAVDVRNGQGNLFYCELKLTGGGKVLTLTSVAGLDPADRVLELEPWTPEPEPAENPPPAPGNLLADLWAEDPMLVAAREKAVPRPILDPTADRIVAGIAIQGTALAVLGATLLSLLGR